MTPETRGGKDAKFFSFFPSLSLTFSSFSFLKDTALAGQDPIKDGARRIFMEQRVRIESYGRWETSNLTSNKRKVVGGFLHAGGCMSDCVCTCM